MGLRLRNDLYDGSFAPGEAISIRALAEEEGLSVIPARDALRALVGAGALRFRDSRTIEVPQMATDAVEQMRYARIAIEGELAARAAARVNKAFIGALCGIDDEVTRALMAQDVAGYMQANRAFHFTLYQAADAPVLFEVAQGLWLRFGPAMRIVCESYAGVMPQTDHHRGAIAALWAYDGEALRAAIEADIAQGMDRILAYAATQKDT
ncbi:GntR family transcriptional regulator [Alphaproteobacteria bacterium KMM 3653]|uniref:GntR family transcriptional regulator n=1 Tax=Harenicola maris TaxID=2841044 RepID=A0AAP2CRR5_9RHOB|nr:GntR family transcriptional regulator [Harenicola maris]